MPLSLHSSRSPGHRLARVLRAAARRLQVVALVLLATLTLPGCAQAPRRELVVWCGLKEAERTVLERVAAGFSQRTGVPVRIVRVPFEELQPKLQVSVPVGQGPDLVSGPHDWIGRFVITGLIAPVDLPPAALEPYLPVSLDVTRYGGHIYGLPVSVTALALVTNRALLPQPPRSMPELIEAAQRLTRDGRYGFLFDDTDFFFAWPFFGGAGATLFEPGASGPDPERLGLRGEPARQAMRFLHDLHARYHLIPEGTNKNSANSRFLDGQCAMTITGPWSLQEYRARHIDYVVTPIPALDTGRWPSPLVGVDALMLTTSSREPALAAQLLLELAGCEAQVQLHLAAGRVPARRDAQRDPRVAHDADVAALVACVDRGTPMPTLPAMGQVWGPMADALRLMTTGKLAPESALDEAVDRIQANIRRMMQ